MNGLLLLHNITKIQNLGYFFYLPPVTYTIIVVVFTIFFVFVL